MLLCRATFQLVSTQPILVHGINLPQLQDLVLNIVGLNEIPVCSFLQPVYILLNAYTATWSIRCISCIRSFGTKLWIHWRCASLSQSTQKLAGVSFSLSCQLHMANFNTNLGLPPTLKLQKSTCPWSIWDTTMSWVTVSIWCYWKSS